MARKNTLRYILLGLLSKKKMTGYELNQSFKNEIGEWSWFFFVVTVVIIGETPSGSEPHTQTS